MDSSIALWLNQVAQHPGVRQAVEIAAKFLIAFPVLIMAGLTGRALLRQDAAALSSAAVAIAGTLVGLGANVAATSWWYRARPYHALTDVHALVAPTPESSFFSDHTVVVTGMAVGALLMSRRWGIAAAAVAVGVAIGRVAVGAHYPSDTLAAAAVTCLAIAILLPARPLLERLIHVGLDRVSRRPSPDGAATTWREREPEVGGAGRDARPARICRAFA